jgi:hypothetical protein
MDYFETDQKGEFLAAVAAAPVYELLGKRSLETEVYPASGVPILHDLGYFMHSGGHGALPSPRISHLVPFKDQVFQLSL